MHTVDIYTTFDEIWIRILFDSPKDYHGLYLVYDNIANHIDYEGEFKWDMKFIDPRTASNIYGMTLEGVTDYKYLLANINNYTKLHEFVTVNGENMIIHNNLRKYSYTALSQIGVHLDENDYEEDNVNFKNTKNKLIKTATRRMKKAKDKQIEDDADAVNKLKEEAATKIQSAARMMLVRKKLAAKLEEERLAAVQAESDRLEQERLAAVQAEKDRVERERLATVKAEANELQRAAYYRNLEIKREDDISAAQAKTYKLEQERRTAQAEKDRVERERLAAVKAEANKLQHDTYYRDLEIKREDDISAAQAKTYKLEQERLAAQAESDRLKQERLAAVKAEANELQRAAYYRDLEIKREDDISAAQAKTYKLEQERRTAVQAESDRLERERLAAVKAEADMLEQERSNRLTSLNHMDADIWRQLITTGKYKNVNVYEDNGSVIRNEPQRVLLNRLYDKIYNVEKTTVVDYNDIINAMSMVCKYFIAKQTYLDWLRSSRTATIGSASTKTLYTDVYTTYNNMIRDNKAKLLFEDSVYMFKQYYKLPANHNANHNNSAISNVDSNKIDNPIGFKYQYQKALQNAPTLETKKEPNVYTLPDYNKDEPAATGSAIISGLKHGGSIIGGANRIKNVCNILNEVKEFSKNIQPVLIDVLLQELTIMPNTTTQNITKKIQTALIQDVQLKHNRNETKIAMGKIQKIINIPDDVPDDAPYTLYHYINSQPSYSQILPILVLHNNQYHPAYLFVNERVPYIRSAMPNTELDAINLDPSSIYKFKFDDATELIKSSRSIFNVNPRCKQPGLIFMNELCLLVHEQEQERESIRNAIYVTHKNTQYYIKQINVDDTNLNIHKMNITCNNHLQHITKITELTAPWEEFIFGMPTIVVSPTNFPIVVYNTKPIDAVDDDDDDDTVDYKAESVAESDATDRYGDYIFDKICKEIDEDVETETNNDTEELIRLTELTDTLMNDKEKQIKEKQINKTKTIVILHKIDDIYVHNRELLSNVPKIIEHYNDIIQDIKIYDKNQITNDARVPQHTSDYNKYLAAHENDIITGGGIKELITYSTANIARYNSTNKPDNVTQLQKGVYGVNIALRHFIISNINMYPYIREIANALTLTNINESIKCRILHSIAQVIAHPYPTADYSLNGNKYIVTKYTVDGNRGRLNIPPFNKWLFVYDKPSYDHILTL